MTDDITAPDGGQDDPVVIKARQLRAAGVPLPEIEKYVASKRAKATPNAPSTAPRSAPEPGYGERLAAHVLSAAQGIPGMEAIEAAGGALGSHIPASVPLIGSTHPMSYQESLEALRGNTDQIGGGTKFAEKAMGSLATLPLVAGRTAVQAGALLGGADQALSADPIHSGSDAVMRVGKTALGAGVGAGLGKVLETGVTAARGLAAGTPGEESLAMQASRKLGDTRSYGTATREAADHYATGLGTPQAVDAAFAKPDIKPFVDIVKGERAFATADDGTVLREVFKRMGKEQGGLARRLKEQGYDAAMQGKLNNLAAAKDELLAAADQFMPSFRGAVAGHAEAMGERGALQAGVDAGRRFMRNSKTPPTKLETKSPEAILRLVASLPPEQQAAAEQGLLGELGASAKIGMEPTMNTALGLTKGFGVGPYVADASRVQPLLRAANTSSQQRVDAALKALLLAAHSATSR